MDREHAEFIVEKLDRATRDMVILKSFVRVYKDQPTSIAFDHIMTMINNIGEKVGEVQKDAQDWLDDHPSEDLIDDDLKYDQWKHDKAV